jgi:hypothetical protein
MSPAFAAIIALTAALALALALWARAGMPVPVYVTRRVLVYTGQDDARDWISRLISPADVRRLAGEVAAMDPAMLRWCGEQVERLAQARDRLRLADARDIRPAPRLTGLRGRLPGRLSRSDAILGRLGWTFAHAAALEPDFFGSATAARLCAPYVAVFGARPIAPTSADGPAGLDQRHWADAAEQASSAAPDA